MNTPSSSSMLGQGPGSLGKLIERDVACEDCGYSLRGLYTRSACPECGTYIRDKTAGSDVRQPESLVDTPIGYLKKLVVATAATACIGVLMTLGQLYLAVYNFPGRGVLQAVSPLLWIGAVFLVTARRPTTEATTDDMMLDRAWFRTLVRVMQLAWPAGVAVMIAPGVLAGLGVPVPGWSGTAATILGSMLVFVAAIGLAPLCLYLAALADWANADGIADRLRTAAFFTGVFGVLSVLLALISMIPFLLGPIAGVLSIITGILAIVGIGLLVVSMVQLALLAYWAVKNWHESKEREQRMELKRQAREAELAHRMSKIAAAQSAGVSSHAPRVSPVEHRIERRNDSDEAIEVIGSERSDESDHADAAAAPAFRHFANEDVRARADDVSPYGLEPDTPDLPEQ
jgi:uncharacterized membrane protein